MDYKIVWLAIPAALLAACGGSSTGDGGTNGGNQNEPGLIFTPQAALELEAQSTCTAFNDYVTNAVTGLIVNGGGFSGCRDCLVTLAGGAAAAPALGTDARSFQEFTQTNNQDNGVDELDQVETDANGNFFLLDGDALVVTNGLPPANLREIARLAIGRGTAGLLLDPDNRRVVIARTELALYRPVLPIAPTLGLLPPEPINPLTELVFVNVANPAAPTIERRMKIEGFHIAVRRIGARVHLVTHTTPFMPLPLSNDTELRDLQQRLGAVPQDSDAAKALAGDVRRRVSALVATTDPLDYLPNVSTSVGTQAWSDVTPANCANVAIPDVPMPLALTAVTSVDSDGTDVASLVMPNNSWSVYASDQHLYLAQTSAGWWFSRNQHQETAIYKIAIGAGRPSYRAFGSVEGFAGSSFQFSEHQGYLRVATNRWERDPATDRWLQDNHLYVLGDNNAGKLNVVGKVAGFGAGERIFSARFLGNRGFVVTFRQIDPLFTFDLSVPQDPRLVGQVEIPGVSTYLHPLDDAHLLTIGFDGDQNRLNGNFQLQIFDVQNLREPRLLHKFVPKFEAPGFAWTQATHDHLAFNYFPAGGTLTVPVQYFGTTLRDHFSGFVAFSVSPAAGFAELGRLDHSDLAQREHCSTPTGLVPVICTAGRYLEAAFPRRAVSAQFNGSTYIYTLSNVGMKVSAAPTFGTPVAVLPLPGNNLYPWSTGF